MGYLGLSDPVEKQDNFFQRIFWPSDHAGEVDTLGQRGFWLCTILAILISIVLSSQGHWAVGLLSLLFFGLAGIGVREHSTSAAVLAAAGYLINLIAGAVVGAFPGILGIAAALLLLANIRGTWIAARWMKRGDPEAFAERMSETWRDRLVDQMPARIWPWSRIVFYCVAALYILMSVAGTVVLARRHAAQAPQVDITVDGSQDK